MLWPHTRLSRTMNHFSLHSFALILLSLSISSANAISFPSRETNTSADTRLALLSFKSMLIDPLRSLTSWNNTTSLHYCTWRGVMCGRRHPLQVVVLDLESFGLSGTISPFLSNLTFLRELYLSDNQLHGEIPEELGRLSRLRVLNLSKNRLEGEIPVALSHCSHLESIILRNNKLSGEIPSNLTRCFNLKTLSLTNNTLGGEIPTGIGSLPMLEKLLLSGNNFNGHIPPLLGRSPSLTRVMLWDNDLTGSIPSLLCNSTSLAALDLSENQLTGGIPSFLTDTNRRSPLFYLVLYRNHLTGHISPSLGNLSSLQYLYLNENDLVGSIPQSLGNILGLQYLDLSRNRLSNIIPSSLYNVSTIIGLNMGRNRLFGTLPQDLGLTLPNLEILRLYENQFEGPIPASLSNASGLTMLDLGNNSFSGTVPSSLGSLGRLQELHLEMNQLTSNDWGFLSSLTNCSLLEELSLNQNNLRGALPSSIGKLSTRLEWLVLGNNPISGTIPLEIGNLVNLVTLAMYKNLFSGNIPASIGKLVKLSVLDLSGNNISGPIPSAIGNLDQLTKLYIEGNKLTDDIPASFGGCRSLQLLNLSDNELGGTIPRELFTLSSLTQLFDISHNALIGPIPVEVGKLINLGILDVSENQLSGDIPPALGSCQHLEHLYMEGNFFQGNIPQSFEKLKGLRELDLSRNNLTGEIPDFLESLGSLQSLNLSFNNFEGELPINGVFGYASEISVMGNDKLCGGHPELRLPTCTTYAPDQRSNNLEIIILTVSAVIILLLSILSILYMRKKKTGVKGPSPTSTFDGERYIRVTYSDIHKATDGFSPANLLGAGSFGSVYKGKVNFEKSFVAVKILNLNQKGALRSFTAECEALRIIRHRNLVRIITACSSVDYRGNEFKALIFEYIPNGSLEQWLHPEVVLDQSQLQKLTLIQRLNIAVDVASALSYLHHSCQPPLVHCDLKPSNIFIDNDMMAHVGDFGLAKLLSKSISVSSKNSTSSMGIKGTVGYVAPEYGMGGRVSIEGDVYSFGVLLLEMLTGKKPTDEMFKDGLNLRKFVEMAFSEDVMKVLDPCLVSGHEVEEEVDDIIMNESSICRKTNRGCMISLIRIGLLCSTDAPRERMTMRDALTEMHEIKEELSITEA